MFPLLMHKRNKKERSAGRKQKSRAVQNVTYEAAVETSVPETETYLEAAPVAQCENAYNQDQHDATSTKTATAEVLSYATYVVYPACKDACLFHYGKSEQLYKHAINLQRSDSACENKQTSSDYNQGDILESEYNMSAKKCIGSIPNVKTSKVRSEVEVITLTDDELQCRHILDTGKTVSRCTDGPIVALPKNDYHPHNIPVDLCEGQSNKSEFVYPLDQFGEGGKPSEKISEETVKQCANSQDISGDQTVRPAFRSSLRTSTGDGRTSSDNVSTSASSFDSNGRCDETVIPRSFHVCSLYRSSSLSPCVTFVGQPYATMCWRAYDNINEEDSNLPSGLLASFATDAIPLIPLMSSMADNDVESTVQRNCLSNTPTTTGRLGKEKTDEEVGAMCVPQMTKTEQRPILTYAMVSKSKQEERPIMFHTALQKQDEMCVGSCVVGNQNEVMVTDNSLQKQKNVLCEKWDSTDELNLFESSKELNSQVNWLNSASSINKEMKDVVTQISTRRIRKKTSLPKTYVSKATQTLPLRKKSNRQSVLPLATSTACDYSNDVNYDLTITDVNTVETIGPDNGYTTIQQLLNYTSKQETNKGSGSKLTDGLKHASTESAGNGLLTHKTSSLQTPNRDLKYLQNPDTVSERDTAVRHTNKKWILKASGEDSYKKSRTSENVKTMKQCDGKSHHSHLDSASNGVHDNKIDRVQANLPKVLTSVPEHEVLSFNTDSKMDSHQSRMLWRQISPNTADDIVGVPYSELDTSTVAVKIRSSDYLHVECQNPLTVDKNSSGTCLKSSATVRSNATFSPSNESGHLISLHAPTNNAAVLNSKISVYSNTSSDTNAKTILVTKSPQHLNRPLSLSPGVGRKTSKEQIKKKMDASEFVPYEEETAENVTLKHDTKIKRAKKLNSTWEIHLDRGTISKVRPNKILPLPSIRSPSTSNKVLPPTLGSDRPILGTSSGSHSQLRHTSCATFRSPKLLPNVSVFNATQESNTLLPVDSCSVSPNSADEFNRPLLPFPSSSDPMLSPAPSRHEYDTRLPDVSSSPPTSSDSIPEYDSASTHGSQHCKLGSKNTVIPKSDSSTHGSKYSRSTSRNVSISESNSPTFGSKHSLKVIAVPEAKMSLLGSNNNNNIFTFVSNSSMPNSPVLRSNSSMSRSNSSVSGSNSFNTGSNSVILGSDGSIPGFNRLSPDPSSGLIHGSNKLLPHLSPSPVPDWTLSLFSHNRTYESDIALTGVSSSATPNCNISTCVSSHFTSGHRRYTPKSGCSPSGSKHSKPGSNGMCAPGSTCSIIGSDMDNTETVTKLDKTNINKCDVVENNELRPDTERGKHITANDKKPKSATVQNPKHLKMLLEQNIVQPQKMVEQKLTQPQKMNEKTATQPEKTAGQTFAESEKAREQKVTQSEKVIEQKVTQSEEAREQKVTQSEKAREQKVTKPEKAREQKVTQSEKAREQKVTQSEKAREQKVTKPEKQQLIQPEKKSTTQCLSDVSDKEYMQLIADGSLPLLHDVKRWQTMFGLQADTLAARAKRLLVGDMSDVCEGLSLDELETVETMRQQMNKMTDNELFGSISQHI